MKTYTDDEIVRALECCLQSRSMDDCKKLNCPAYVNNDCYFMSNVKAYGYEDALFKGLCTQSLDLIKRQQAEIEKLNKVKVLNITVSDTKEIMPILFCHEKELKNEAVKEFAERLKHRLERKYTIYGREHVLRHLRELVKEMTEGKSERNT